MDESGEMSLACQILQIDLDSQVISLGIWMPSNQLGKKEPSMDKICIGYKYHYLRLQGIFQHLI